ncbi:MAG: flavin monoamine oxidase family protein [Acidimicrobiales bacterium]
MPGNQFDRDVCVIGAGYAGLTAARRLVQGGKSVAVLEARDRVGGRVWTRLGHGATPIDMGGTFVGSNHDRLRALATEMGVDTFATHVAGDTILAGEGKVRRYRGDVPRINPLALLSAGAAIARLDRMAKTVPVDAPWDAPSALAWDGRTVASWLSAANVPTTKARQLIETTFRACFACELSEVSMLNLLLLIHSAGGVSPLMTVEGGYQQDQFVGGAQSMANAMAGELEGSIHLSSPVQAVTQTNHDVVVASPKVSINARHVVVAIPPCLVGAIRFDPPLPADRVLLQNQMPAGTELKSVAVYDEPFWRSDGLSGASVDMEDLFEVTLDTTPPSGQVGVMACYAAGNKARRLAGMGPDARREAALGAISRRFGPKASSPLEVMEQNWAEEEWTRGCSMAHFGTGVLTQYGRMLRQVVGRVHWAGTETAGTSYGAIDGAVRSGERVASEILTEPEAPIKTC